MSVGLVHREANLVPLAIGLDEVARLADAVLAAEGVERACEVSLSVVDDDEMAAMNEELRGIAAPTDVLSVELERPDEAPGDADEPCLLGDLVLDPAYIERQAREFATSPEDETRLLVIHGMLHLLGYDHETPEDRMRMEAVQERLVRDATEGRVAPFELASHGEEP